MSSEQDAQSRRNGQQAVWRQTFGQVLDILDDTQATTLLELVTANLASLRGLWMDRKPRSGFREDFLHELAVIQFLLRERLKLGPRHDAAGQKLYFVCLKCDIPVIHASGDDEPTCPGCQSDEWLVGTTT